MWTLITAFEGAYLHNTYMIKNYSPLCSVSLWQSVWDSEGKKFISKLIRYYHRQGVV